MSAASALLDTMRDAAAIASHGDHRERAQWARYDEAEASLQSLIAAKFDDETVARLAQYIYATESRQCKTVDDMIWHQSNWRRAIPEARKMLEAAFGAEPILIPALVITMKAKP